MYFTWLLEPVVAVLNLFRPGDKRGLASLRYLLRKRSPPVVQLVSIRGLGSLFGVTWVGLAFLAAFSERKSVNFEALFLARGSIFRFKRFLHFFEHEF